MKRPIELIVALAVLVCEYFAVLPGYISSYIANVTAGTATAQLTCTVVGFVLFRPLVLYLLWRGTSWVRTLFIWTMPLLFTLAILFHRTGPQASPQSHNGPFAAVDTLAKGSLITTIALVIGFLAFLALYSPRVGAWFRFMKHARSGS